MSLGTFRTQDSAESRPAIPHPARDVAKRLIACSAPRLPRIAEPLMAQRRTISGSRPLVADPEDDK
jgi:hypothetical protein